MILWKYTEGLIMPCGILCSWRATLSCLSAERLPTDLQHCCTTAGHPMGHIALKTFEHGAFPLRVPYHPAVVCASSNRIVPTLSVG